MSRAILIHILGTILYLLCFMYVTNGIDLSPLGRGANVFILIIVNFIAYIFCIDQNLYKKNK